MATAYLLASVLTLLVVLVQGQKAIHEQEIQVKTDKLVEFADDIFEDELNSDIDVLLLDSANTRAECNQKKKCKNKGGTCQNKGNACAGKSVKGCSKGCSCCLPEEILCKPSKKCKRANGACISRSECNGKIVAKGCKKPKNCKRTHVCCVQDVSTTTVPPYIGCPFNDFNKTALRTTRGCQVVDECPNGEFRKKYVCNDCKKETDPTKVQKFMKALKLQPPVVSYPVFYKLDYNSEYISYVINGDNTVCTIKNPAKTWTCNLLDNEGEWKCEYQGFRIGGSSFSNGAFIEGSMKRKCPNEKFQKGYVCENCKKNRESLGEFAKKHGEGNIHYVFAKEGYRGNKISYITSEDDDSGLCTIKNPVMAWKCTPPPPPSTLGFGTTISLRPLTTVQWMDGDWICSLIGFCIGKSGLSNGDYKEGTIEILCPNGKFYDDHICEECPDRAKVWNFVNNLKFETDPGEIDSYRVFSNKDNEDKYINFISRSIEDDTFCLIENPVKTWICTRKKEKNEEGKWEWKWRCTLKGFCTGKSNFKTGNYREDSEKCVCPNGQFYEKNVCEKCTNTKKAEEFVSKVTHNQIEISSYPVFGSKDYNGNVIKFIISANNECLIESPVETWICNNKNLAKKWTCDMKGFCTGKSNFVTGNYIEDSEECKCPNGNFIKKHVCKGCDSRGLAVEFLKVVQQKPVVSYTVFGDKDYNGEMIKFTTSDDKKLCIIENPVQIWICKPKNEKWDPEECKLQGFCTAKSDFITGTFEDDTIDCNCPSPYFKEKHVCPYCKNGIEALEYTNNRQNGDGPNTVFDGREVIIYNEIKYDNQKTCQIIQPVSVKAWDVMRNVKKEWYFWQDLGQCINLQSALNNGHLFFELKKCFKVHDNWIWTDEKICPTVGVIFEGTNPESCMEECKSIPECTAFNYKKDDKKCTMRKCPVPVPPPDEENSGFKGYYLNTGYKQTTKIWGDECPIVPVDEVFIATDSVECMKECKSRPGCTAINYNTAIKECIMRQCPVPVPTPETENPGFVGYYLFDIGPPTQI